MVYDISFYTITEAIELEPLDAAPTELARYMERFDFLCFPYCRYMPGLEIRCVC